MDRGARKGRRRAAPDGREEEKAHHSFMAQRRKEGAHPPQAHLSSDAHAAAAELGRGPRSAMCAGRGAAEPPGRPPRKRIP